METENIKTDLSLFTSSSQTNWISGHLAVCSFVWFLSAVKGLLSIARNEKGLDNSHSASSGEGWQP